MADGIYPGPKGLRKRILQMWSRSAAMPAPQQIEPPAPQKPEAPAPAYNPPGMTAARRALWPEPANDLKPERSPEKLSYTEDLKARVRGEEREGRSILKRDFDQERF
ncbi:hypothetical protein [Hyphomicrobium sp.]|uniref:hypothetical protein n=1 Tax=Hyphomicrobium sp. TaxID=82 RepID=UPI003F71BAB2